jgi:hypothetical protein
MIEDDARISAQGTAAERNGKATITTTKLNSLFKIIASSGRNPNIYLGAPASEIPLLRAQSTEEANRSTPQERHAQWTDAR